MKYAIIFALFIIGCAQTKETTNEIVDFNEKINAIESNDSSIVWHSFENGYELAKLSNKKVFVDIYTDWCGWCKKMDAATFIDKSVVSLMNQNFIAVKLDAEQKDTLRFNQVDYTFVNSGRRGYHQFAAVLLDGQMSYPSFTVLDSNGKRIKKIVGYQSPEQLITALSFGE